MNQTFEEILNDEAYAEGYQAGIRKSAKKALSAKKRIEWAIQTLLSVGTDEADELIQQLKKAANELK